MDKIDVEIDQQDSPVSVKKMEPEETMEVKITIIEPARLRRFQDYKTLET